MQVQANKKARAEDMSGLLATMFKDTQLRISRARLLAGVNTRHPLLHASGSGITISAAAAAAAAAAQ
jgi:hypothetical protein